MAFIKLPSNSEKILLKLAKSSNPSQTLIDLYKNASMQFELELDAIIKELTDYGYINVKWANDMPYIVIINNSGRRYSEQFVEYELQTGPYSEKQNIRNMIFISHSSTDKDIAILLRDFFCNTGIPRDSIFCSSIVGNDVNEKIPDEVKNALKKSAVNIAILSHNYYQSPYCLNEAGILWYEDTPVIPIALPEINPHNMLGFLNNEYKIRRLDLDTDVCYLYDTVISSLSIKTAKSSIITEENNKLRNKYTTFLKNREQIQQLQNNLISPDISKITTDDEKIVLYYILKQNVRKVSKREIENWLIQSEIYDVNLENGFDLLSSLGAGCVNNDTLELDITLFRQYSLNSEPIMTEFKQCVDKHTKLSSDTFNALWNSNSFDDIQKLFIAYIVDERMCSLGTRWKAENQIKDIKNWEEKNMLIHYLSKNYGTCINFFIENFLVYKSRWTKYGNPCEYSLQFSLKNFLLNCPIEIKQELEKVKNNPNFVLPF